MATNRRLALLIDGDNAQASLLGEMLAEASKYGLLTIRRVYGDWTEPELKSWKEVLHTYAIQPVQQFRYTVGKNATDSAMIIEAMDILYTGGVDGFCLVSSDSDYTRLATRIREQNMFVMGIGKQKITPRPFVDACDVFVYTENLVVSAVAESSAPAQETPTVAKTKSEGDKLQKNLAQLARTAYESAAPNGGWVKLSVMGDKLRQLDPAFDPRTYGYRQLSLLVQAHPELFEVRKSKAEGNPVMSVRVLPQKKK